MVLVNTFYEERDDILRNPRFVTIRRGGNLSPDEHIKLMQWAISCFSRVVIYSGEKLDEPISHAIKVAEGWCRGTYTTGDAISASRSVHSFATRSFDPVVQAVARSVGQGVATAHMADHCVGAALYAQKVLKLAGKSYEEEKMWQVERLNQLPKDLADLVRATLSNKEKGLGL